MATNELWVDYSNNDHNYREVALKEISTQNGPFNSNSNSMSSCVSH